MDRNVRIARELVRIAKSLVAAPGRKDWTEIVRQKRPDLDPVVTNEQIHAFMNAKQEAAVAHWLLDNRSIKLPDDFDRCKEAFKYGEFMQDMISYKKYDYNRFYGPNEMIGAAKEMLKIQRDYWGEDRVRNTYGI